MGDDDELQWPVHLEVQMLTGDDVDADVRRSDTTVAGQRHEGGMKPGHQRTPLEITRLPPTAVALGAGATTDLATSLAQCSRCS